MWRYNKNTLMCQTRQLRKHEMHLDSVTSFLISHFKVEDIPLLFRNCYANAKLLADIFFITYLLVAEDVKRGCV